ncbi:15-hydroxyprostaglandin dehydrogenase [NAD(+)]-like [Schistocerca cancellata]|uniref:15-hydroxyprostaglandin dehydrogenase [NAD(+)]-like n=2 Tax=Schistocerca TaxID=7008 RepID=UPI002117A17A|nr:15-hydroxyprostaglandin dehydrogenase [NAD(+)]-like [Schistocerca cancellata]
MRAAMASSSRGRHGSASSWEAAKATTASNTTPRQVALSDVDAAVGQKFAQELEQQFGSGRVVFVKADVTDAAQLEEVFKKAKSTFKRLDIVINNAGIMRDSIWEKQIDINMKGVVHGMLLAFKHMGKEGGGPGGLVVNVASIVGVSVVANLPIYCGTKHAVVAMTRGYGMPVNVERTGVKVVALCPGATDTPLLNDAKHYLLHPQLAGDLQNAIDTFGMNKPEQIAEGLMHVIRNAESGSAWVSNLGDHYEVHFPQLHK